MLTQKANFKILEKQIQRGIGYGSPAFRYNLFGNVSAVYCPAEFIEASAINPQSFDRLRMTRTKSISTAIGFGELGIALLLIEALLMPNSPDSSENTFCSTNFHRTSRII